MSRNRKIVSSNMKDLNSQEVRNAMEEFEAMMYIPVSLAQLELVLTGKQVVVKAHGQKDSGNNNRAKLFSQVA